MRMFCFVAVLVACLPVVANATIIREHVGATNPATEGWYLANGVPGYADGDAWRIATAGYGRYRPSAPGPNAAWFDSDWSLTARVQHIAGPMAEQRLTVFDGQHGKGGAFTWDADTAYWYYKDTGDTPLPGTNPKEMHSYTFSYEQATGIGEIWYDDTLIDTLAPAEINDVSIGTFLVYWGDNNSQAFSDMRWAGVTFRDEQFVPIPEPSTIALLLIGFVALVMWRWRR